VRWLLQSSNTLKSHGRKKAQREFELKDGPKGPPPAAIAKGNP
jgi:hypothetical protein